MLPSPLRNPFRVLCAHHCANRFRDESRITFRQRVVQVGGDGFGIISIFCNEGLRRHLLHVHFPTFSPSSTRRRMASERDISCEAAHASRFATAAGSSRTGMVSLYFIPAGRPLDFLCTVFDCFAIIICVREKQAEGKMQSSASAPGEAQLFQRHHVVLLLTPTIKSESNDKG